MFLRQVISTQSAMFACLPQILPNLGNRDKGAAYSTNATDVHQYVDYYLTAARPAANCSWTWLAKAGGLFPIILRITIYFFGQLLCTKQPTAPTFVFSYRGCVSVGGRQGSLLSCLLFQFWLPVHSCCKIMGAASPLSFSDCSCGSYFGT